MINRNDLNSLLEECLDRYHSSPLMAHANEKAKNALIHFMETEFLPRFEEYIVTCMDENGVNELDKHWLLQEIHESLYRAEGYSIREHEIFKATDPEGYERFLKEAAQRGFLFHL